MKGRLERKCKIKKKKIVHHITAIFGAKLNVKKQQQREEETKKKRR